MKPPVDNDDMLPWHVVGRAVCRQTKGKHTLFHATKKIIKKQKTTDIYLSLKDTGTSPNICQNHVAIFVWFSFSYFISVGF
ncbi:hypothetical protein XELAEV_18046746mg [Xenopus laevis]|uniref:Uncharacterized protein n=1 Tax=Xenopus laevis TaxID=8355 RepID=A0A974H154_XENLA|nr:hypothetical protein XELAEV_18046746mg [Xenopus laevis]